MRVLVIPEDPRTDHYVLLPLFKRMFKALGKPRARIEIYWDPLLGGVSEALKSERIQEVIDLYDWWTAIFILCVDRDGVEGRRQSLDRIESEFGQERTFVAACAWEGIETWALAGVDLPATWSWADVRAEIHVKETYFDVLAKRRGVADEPGGGRKTLGREAARNIVKIRRKCPEDFGALVQRIETII